jgi:nitroreductase
VVGGKSVLDWYENTVYNWRRRNIVKKIIFVLCVLCITVSFVAAQDNTAIKAIIHHYAARNFFPGSVSQGDLDQIVEAAIHAPSANNRQPWHFTVVQNYDLARRIISNVNEGNVLFVISTPDGGKTNPRQVFDCALAAQSVYLAAQALGLGSRIYTGPVDAVNKNLKSALGLPNDHSVVAIIRIGKAAQVDAVSAASSRKNADSVVTYKK